MPLTAESVSILGIHGLGPKPPEENYALNWGRAISDGLRRNLSLELETLPFQLVYWGLWNYTENQPKENYIAADGTGPYPVYGDRWLDEVSAEVLGVAGDALDVSKAVFGLNEVGDPFLRKKLADLSVYYNEAAKREALRGLLRKALEVDAGRRMMLVAHSMGTVIAYDVLRELGRTRPDFTVDHFVTLGSPLGLPYVVDRIRREWGRPRVPFLRPTVS